MMKAILLKGFGAAQNLYIGETARPRPEPNQLLVRVRATSLNRADILQRQGHYPPPPGTSDIIGLEMAGEIEEVGPECPGWKKGDRVAALLPGGGYAQYVTIPASLALPIPDNLSFEQAAAIPEAYMTAYQALFWLGGLKKHQNVLVHAGASGVGIAATQMAVQSEAKVFVTAGGPAKCQFCSTLGINQAIDYKSHPNWDKVIMDATSNSGVDLVVDFVGASYFSKNLATLNTDGTLVLLALLSGSTVGDPINIGTILRKRLNIRGSTLRNRDLSYKEKLSHEFWAYAKPLFQSGTLKPVIDSVYPWDRVAEAHTKMENNANIGKIVLTVE